MTEARINKNPHCAIKLELKKHISLTFSFLTLSADPAIRKRPWIQKENQKQSKHQHLNSIRNVYKPPIFRQNHLNGVTAICQDLRRLSSIVHHKLSGSYNSRRVWPRIPKFYKDILTDQAYKINRYEVTSYFWSAVIAKNVKNAVSDGLRFTSIWMGALDRWFGGQWVTGNWRWLHW